jgi:hypothetical protein
VTTLATADTGALLQLVPVQRAGAGLLLAAIGLPVIGVVIVGLDIMPVWFAMRHVALLGIAVGLLTGLDPMRCALVACALAGAGVAPLVVRGDLHPQLALATYLGIDRTVMTYLIDELVTAGLVERRLNPADRRQRKIVATARGVSTLRDLRRQVREAEGRLLNLVQKAGFGPSSRR